VHSLFTHWDRCYGSRGFLTPVGGCVHRVTWLTLTRAGRVVEVLTVDVAHTRRVAYSCRKIWTSEADNRLLDKDRVCSVTDALLFLLTTPLRHPHTWTSLTLPGCSVPERAIDTVALRSLLDG